MIRFLFRLLWGVGRYPFWVGVGVFFGFMVPYTIMLNHRVQERFNDLVFSAPTRIYSRPLELKAGVPLTPEALVTELDFSGYKRTADGKKAGTYARHNNRFVISSYGFHGAWVRAPAKRIVVTLANRYVSAVSTPDGQAVKVAYLDPARIATVYGAHQEERRIVSLRQLPTLLVTGLQAVEDRHFNRNIGIDFRAIVRAALADLRAGRIVQGGSTLTQQLVRNLFLDRNQTLVRKVNEALMAVLIKTHYSKARILDAYVNEVFLGQRGYQAVHGFAAASEFYFNQRVKELSPDQIALLVGLVRGPSYYDPRRYPERAMSRRNRVLDVFNKTGLLSSQETTQAKARPLGITSKPSLPSDRFPAFMDLVRVQVQHDFSQQQLRNDRLSIYTTLDPVAQLSAEAGIASALKHLGKQGAALQAAGIVTNPNDGEVLAVVGSRFPRRHGFNRALNAHRPVGSIIKPLVYLVALANPQRWSLASLLSDTPVKLAQENGTVWTPENDDHKSHGNVFLVDALVKSWNLATVHLGLSLGVDRIVQFLQQFGLKHINTNPSLLLGAIDLSPAQVAYLYQFIASKGRAVPLVALRGVTDNKGKVLRRYQIRRAKAQYELPIKLITHAMQQVAVRGTASSIRTGGLGWLHAAGKTGTSDKQRDSWFAGFTANRLGVFWMGRDDNKPTSIWGSSGALVAWRYLFTHMPSKPLPVQLGQGIDYVWIDPQTGDRTQPECQGARHIPFIAGTEPEDIHGCFWQKFNHVFGD